VRLADSRWLTDENIHPEVVPHLRARELDGLDVKEQDLIAITASVRLSTLPSSGA
jgi:hypothetical protein